MRNDRVTQLLLTLIAAGLWALILAEVGLPDLAAPAEAASAPPPAPAAQVASKPGAEASPVRASTATLPLRWKVSWAVERAIDTTFCGTAVVVTNGTDSLTNVEVEWFWYNGASIDLRPLSVNGLSQKVWITSDDVSGPDTDARPFAYDDAANTAEFLGGYARVHADDPRIEVAAYQYCRDGQGAGQTILSITQIPSHPVGATADFFQAGMPIDLRAPTPLVAPPEPR